MGPKLGLDLAGGSEVVYKPAHPISSGEMDTTVNIIRNRVDGAGVSGATVDSQGGNVVVQFPGVKNPQALIKLIGTTAQLYFRPVLCGAPAYTPPGQGQGRAHGPAAVVRPVRHHRGQPGREHVHGSTGQQHPAQPGLRALPVDQRTTTRTQTVLLPADPQAGAQQYPRFVLRSLAADGQRRRLGHGGVRHVDQRLGGELHPEGGDAVGQRGPGELPPVRGHRPRRARRVGPAHPAQQAPRSRRSSGKGEISGSFTQATAKTLALELNYGALPTKLNVLTQETVSPTLGKSSLKAGLLAGIGGLILVLIYTILYYRVLGVVVVAGLLTTAALLWAIVSALGHSSLNLTLDLSGVTGVIVSVGITVDSYIVYFERLKDEARSGRSVRTSVDRSFKGAFRTVLAADLVSLAAAVVLYLLAVGTVRGFAFFLGLSTLLDVFTTFFFTRPLVILLGRSTRITEASVIGVARGLAVGSETAGMTTTTEWPPRKTAARRAAQPLRPRLPGRDQVRLRGPTPVVVRGCRASSSWPAWPRSG